MADANRSREHSDMILFAQGINDRGRVRIAIDKRGKPNLQLDGSCNIYGKTRFLGAPISAIMFYGGNVRQPSITVPHPPKLIFNEISDPDTHAIALRRCTHFCRFAAVEVINRPEQILRTSRDQIAQLLRDIPAVTMPRTVRCQANSPEELMQTASAIDLSFPWIARVAGHHGGISMVLVSKPDDIDRLHRYPFGDTTFYLTEFVDYADERGVYRKHRIVFVEGQPLARHAITGDGWNVHAASRGKNSDAGEGEEERARTQDLQDRLIPLAAKPLAAIADRLALDLFGLDCHIDDDGGILVFEANANMNFLHNAVPALEDRCDLLRDRISGMLTRRSGISLHWERKQPE